MGFSRQEVWSGLPFPSPSKDVRRDLKDLDLLYEILAQFQGGWFSLDASRKQMERNNPEGLLCCLFGRV